MELDIARRSFKMAWRCMRTPGDWSSCLWQRIGDDVDGRVPASLPRVGVEVIDDLGQQLNERVIHDLQTNGMS